MATSKKKRNAKAVRKPKAMANGGIPAGLGAMPSNDMDLIVAGDGPTAPAMDLAENRIEVQGDDGMITIQFGEPEKPKKPSSFDDNIAEKLGDTSDGTTVLYRISETLLEAIEQDDRDRSEWLQQRGDGLELLGQKVEKPGTGNVGSSATAVAGQSTVRDSILSEACDQFQANAFAELCPAAGPCKVTNYGDETKETDALAKELENDFNYYLTSIAKEYYKDTRKMLWWTGYASGTFKKVYKCPLRRRPVSESVDGADLIVPSNATDLHNAGRITHRIDMRPSVMKRMQLLGVYRDVPLTQPTPMPNAVTQKEATVTGINQNTTRPEDQDYTVYECYCELDIPGYEHEEDGEPSGLPLPYRVTLDKDSRQILEIRRNWREEDEDQKAKIPFVLFPYGTGLSIYGTGLLQRLGNYTMALTAMLRECIDAGMFASFPGFLYAKPAGRQLQNEFRVPPGGGAPIDVSAVGNNINNAVMPLPYKDVSTAMVALRGQVREDAFRYGSMANQGVAEGKQNAPVGTTLALIEQATQVVGGVHKGLHDAQAEEFGLLKELFREDPESLWRGNRRPAMGKDLNARLAKFKQALEDCEIEPRSDPNVPSRMHRLAKGQTLLQAATQFPNVIDQKAAVERAFTMMDFDDVQSLFVQPQQPGPDPMMMAAQIEAQKVQVQQQKVQVDAAKVQLQHQQAMAQLNQQGEIEATKIATGHAQKMAAGAPGPAQPQFDPHKAAELHLKARDQDLKEATLAVNTGLKQKEMDSKEAIEAFKMGQAAFVHPEAAQIADQQIAKFSDFIEPAAAAASGQPARGSGGAVSEPEPETDPAMDDIERALRIARIAAALQYQAPENPYMQ